MGIKIVEKFRENKGVIRQVVKLMRKEEMCSRKNVKDEDGRTWTEAK